MAAKQTVCTCEAYDFPYRLGGGACNADLVCPHGMPEPGHPDYDGRRCADCDAWAGADLAYSLGHGGLTWAR